MSGELLQDHWSSCADILLIKTTYNQMSRKVKSMQRSGTEAIRTQIQYSKPKREITNITNSQNTKETYGQPIKIIIRYFVKLPVTSDISQHLDGMSR